MVKIITVFGATGAQGGSVARSLLKDDGFSVRAVTRKPKSEAAQSLSKLTGCEVVKGDFDDLNSLRNCLDGAYGCFAVTDYFDHMDKDKEVQQGKNIVDICCEKKVQHLVYSGLESVQRGCGLICHNFDGKAEVERYLAESGILKYTIIRLPFYYENLYGAIPPIKIKENDYILPIPVGNTSIYGFSVAETGECVKEILKDGKKYGGEVIGLSADRFTVKECCDTLTKHLPPLVFKDPQISCEEFGKQKFPGVEEMTNMFRFIRQGRIDRNIELSRTIYPKLLSFNDWVAENKDKLRESFTTKK